MTWTRPIVTLLVLTVLAGAALAVPGPAVALIISGGRINVFGPVGLVAGQTARANISSLPSDQSLGGPDTRCDVVFLDNAGTSLLAARGFIIEGGKGGFVDLNRDEVAAVGDARGRLQVRGFVICGGSPNSIQVTLEVFDNATGETRLVTHGFVINYMPSMAQ